MKRDLRKFARQTNIRLFIGFFFLVLLIGDGLIYLIYGKYAALSGIICIVGGFFPILLIWLVMNFIEWITKKANE